jgi:CTP:molybdopterin cytidylyltransferase MocA
MGQTKQLLPLGDRTVIEHCVSTIIASGVMDIVAVLGPDAGDVEKTICDLPVRSVRNTQPGSEMIQSVRTGLHAVDPAASSILICLADHPLVRPETLKALIGLHIMHPGSIIIPSFQRRRGHPTLFPRAVVHEFYAKGTMREVIGDHEKDIIYLSVDDEGVLLDMDNPGDYKMILHRFRG